MNIEILKIYEYLPPQLAPIGIPWKSEGVVRRKITPKIKLMNKDVKKITIWRIIAWYENESGPISTLSESWNFSKYIVDIKIAIESVMNAVVNRALLVKNEYRGW